MPGKILHVINEIRRITQKSNFLSKKKEYQKIKILKKVILQQNVSQEIVKNDESVDR